MNDLWPRISQALVAAAAGMERRRNTIFAVALPVVLLVHLLFAALTIQRSNQDWRPSDQMAEVWLATAAKSDVVPGRSDGIRHPLWSFTAGKLHTEDVMVFFTRGKWLNTVFCLIFLAGLGLWLHTWLPPLATINILLLASLGVLVIRGTYFQPEPLYYIFFLSCLILGCRLLTRPNAWRAVLFGLCGGLAYLAKPSLLPFLLAFVLAWVVRLVLAWRWPRADWPPARATGWLVVAGAIFATLLVPLGRYTAEFYGRPFFNYTQYWMWMDDFRAEANPFARSHPGRAELAALRPDEIPGPAWYFRRHTVGEAVQRAWTGTTEVIARFFFPEPKLPGTAFFWRTGEGHWRQPLAHRGVCLLVLAGLAAVMAWRAPDRWWTEPGAVAALVLVGVAVTLYAGLYGWYHPIGKGDRFMGSLWIPALIGLNFLARPAQDPRPAKLALWMAVQVVISVALVGQIVNVAWRFWTGDFLVTQN